MKKKKLKKEIAELRSEIQALQEKIEKMEQASRNVFIKRNEPDPDWKEECKKAVEYMKKQCPRDPDLIH